MKNVIVLILFSTSFALFAEEPTPQVQEKGRGNIPLMSETQSSPSLPEAKVSAITLILTEMQKGNWTENRAPGPVFNTCSSWEGAVQCYWAVFRTNNLTGRYRKEAYAIYKHLTAEKLQTELHYLKSSPDSLDPYSKAWFLHLAVELAFWAIKEQLPDGYKIAPMAREITAELIHFVGSHLNNPGIKGMDRSLFVFILYALYNYVSLDNTLSDGQFDQVLQTLEDSIKSHFFHRNDGSSIDQEAKAQTCYFMELAGFHRDYLKEKGLLFSGYEEFEERTAQEDKQRLKDCETEYETITFSGKGPGEPKDAISSFYYVSILLLLKKTGGDKAIRHFIRHNPIFHKEFAFSKEVLDDDLNNVLVFSRVAAYAALKELYEDPEWQMDWESIENDNIRTFIEKNVPTFESIIFNLFFSSEPFLLNHRMILKKQESPQTVPTQKNSAY